MLLSLFLVRGPYYNKVSFLGTSLYYDRFIYNIMLLSKKKEKKLQSYPLQGYNGWMNETFGEEGVRNIYSYVIK